MAKNKLRFQAPTTAGEYRVDYRVLDSFGETAAATAIFTVTPLDEEANRDPVPDPLVGRVLAGGSIRIDVPLNGVDPDGDSTQLLNFPRNPTLGSLKEVGNDFFIYESSEAAVGTDEFSYRVYDAFGATGEATVKIAVIPKPSELQPPNAAPDSVSVRPGRIAQVDLMANDSDPQGSPIKVSKELIDVPAGIDAEVVGRQYLVITAPKTEQSFSLRYELTNNRGGKTMSYVLVTVTPDAPLLPPSADDVPLLTKDIAGKKNITVNIFDGYAFNPSGKTKDLVVSLDGPNAAAATLLERNGQIEITPGPTRQAIAYRVTNERDELSAMAFILVPAAVDKNFDEPPMLDPNLPAQYVSMNESRQWKLSDIIVAPSGRDVHIYDKSSVSSIRSNGDSSFVDDRTVAFTPALGYRGPASVTFTVSDGDSKNDPKGLASTVTLPIIVGDPEFRDTPPEFTTPSVQVELGEKTTIDLRESTAHQNPQILQQVTYSGVSPSDSALNAELSGSRLTLSVPRDSPKGATFTVDVTLRWDRFTVPGTIRVTVVGSTRPLAVAVADAYETKRPVGTFVMDPLTNDSNPYQTTGEPLKIVDAKITNAENVGAVTFTGTQIRVTPNSTPPYMVIEVAYTIQDATKDKDRLVKGLIQFTVTDVPAQVLKPAIAAAIGDDRAATITFQAPGTNGKEISSYDVRTVQTGGITAGCVAGAPCTIAGLSNGTPYTFDVRASNENGNGSWSTPSDQVTPYGTPVAPVPTVAAPSTGAGAWAPSGVVNASWPAVGSTGGTTTYFWTFSNGYAGSTTGTTASTQANLPAGSYTISVFATNSGAKSGPPGGSNSAQINNQTTPPQVGTPTATVNDGTAPDGAITWSWPAVGGGPAVTDNLMYEVTYNGNVQQRQGSTNFSRSGLAEGNYGIVVRAINNAGGGAFSGTSNASVGPQPPPDSNVSIVVNGACILNDYNFYNYIDTCSGYYNSGQRILALCRGVRNGVWWFFGPFNPDGGAGYVKASDTDTPYRNIGLCSG